MRVRNAGTGFRTSKCLERKQRIANCRDSVRVVRTGGLRLGLGTFVLVNIWRGVHASSSDAQTLEFDARFDSTHGSHFVLGREFES